jgi:5'-3' exonuclease
MSHIRGMSNPNEEINEDLMRHMVLSTLLSYKKKFKEYGQLVLCADDKNYWRKKIFPHYKALRKQWREESDLDWNNIFNLLNKIRDEVRDIFPYVLIQVESAEADDVIGTLVFYSQDKKVDDGSLYGSSEPIMIVSSDKDFIQLQKFDNVSQWSPMQKKFVTPDKKKKQTPQDYLMEHIMLGDRGDGVPNFLSADDCLVKGERQKGVPRKKLAEWIKKKPEDFCDDKMLAGFHRNRQLVDLSYIPEEIKKQIIEQYEAGPKSKGQRMFNYFVKNRLKYLMDSIGEF